MNRESLWPNYDSTSELYMFISKLVSTRQKAAVWAENQVQRYSSENFYSFSRGDLLVCLTNAGGDGVSVTISYLPASYSEGTTICNALSAGDCTTVSNGKINVVMTGGLPKVYIIDA